MRAISISVTAVFLLSRGLCLGGEGLSARREKFRLAGRILASEYSKTIPNQTMDPRVFHRDMEDNQDLHKATRASERRCLGLAGEYYRDRHAQGAGRLLKRVEGRGSVFSQTERAALLRCPEKHLKDAIAKNFRPAFEEARRLFCREQFGRLTFNVYPSEKEFERYERGRLRTILLVRLVRNQKEPVFEENKKLLMNLVDRILDRAEAQRTVQRRMVERSSGASALTPSGVGAVIEHEVESYRKAERRRIGNSKTDKVYDIFPSVRNMIPRRAVELAAAKYGSALAGMSFPVARGDIRALIAGDIRSHVGKSRSKGICTEAFRDNIQNQALAAHLARAPKSERVGFRSFLEDLRARSSSCRAAMAGVVDRSLDEGFRHARAGIAGDQWSIFRPLSLADGGWRPSKAEIESRHSPEPGSTLTALLDLPGISTTPFDKGMLLEETSGRATNVVRKLVDQGLAALKRQTGILDAVDSELRRELAGREPLPQLPELIRSFTDRTESGWRKARPERAYEALFTRVTRDIKNRARSILYDGRRHRRDSPVRVAKAAKSGVTSESTPRGATSGLGSKPGGPGGGRNGGRGGGGRGLGMGNSVGPGAGGMPSGGDGIPDLIIDLDYVDEERIEVTLILARTGASKRIVLDYKGHDADAPHPGMNKLEEHLESWLRSSAVPGDRRVDLWIVARVFAGKFYYGAVYHLRNCVKGALRSVGDSRLRPHFYDALFGRDQKGRFTLPPRIRFKRRSMSLSC